MSSSAQIGVGLRTPHFTYLESEAPIRVDWFEAISENFMDTEGRPKRVLERVRRDFPIAFHGVSLNIGSTDPVDYRYLKSLKNLYDRFDPERVSDHFCWTGAHGENGHDLYPLPYTEGAVKTVTEKLDLVQNYLGRQILLENTSTYLRFTESEMTEWDFINEICKRSGCGVLLDLNNVFVNSFNHGFDPKTFLEGLNMGAVGQIHIAGFTDEGTHYFDTHSKPVVPEVWELLRDSRERGVVAPVLLEWDQDIPEFNEMENEALKARDFLKDPNGQIERKTKPLS